VKDMNIINVIIEKSENGYAAFIPIIEGCVATGKSLDETRSNLQNAISFHLEGMREDGIEIPDEFLGSFTLQFSFDLETFLNHYGRIFSKRSLSKITGVNESLLSQYAAGLKHPRPKQSKKIEQGLHKLANELLQISL